MLGAVFGTANGNPLAAPRLRWVAALFAVFAAALAVHGTGCHGDATATHPTVSVAIAATAANPALTTPAPCDEHLGSCPQQSAGVSLTSTPSTAGPANMAVASAATEPPALSTADTDAPGPRPTLYALGPIRR